MAWSVCEQDFITLWRCSETERLLVIVTPRILIAVEQTVLDSSGGWVVKCLLLLSAKITSTVLLWIRALCTSTTQTEVGHTMLHYFKCKTMGAG